LIIGIATSVNYMLRGSVTGMSGMLYGTVTLDKSIVLLIFRVNAKKSCNYQWNVTRRWNILQYFWLWNLK